MGKNKPILLIETMREPRKYRFSRLGNVTWLSLVFWETEGSRYEKENKNEINKKNKITKEKMYFIHSFLIKRPTSVIIFYEKENKNEKKIIITKEKVYFIQSFLIKRPTSVIIFYLKQLSFKQKKKFCFYFFDN